MDLAKYLDSATGTILLCDGSGNILWQNARARAVFSKHTNIVQLSGEACARKLLSPLSFTSTQCDTTSQLQHGSWLSVDISGPDPDDVRFLIVKLETEAPEHLLEDRELALTSVAHDLKNPLSAIFGYADALLDSAEQHSLPQPTRTIIARIRRTSARTIELVKNYQALALLKYARPGGQRGTAELNEVVRTSIDNLWRSDPGNHSIRQELAKEAININLPRSLLERVVANLLSNALNYASPSTAIEVKTEQDARASRFIVHNLGPIIAPEELPKIFNAYTRAKNAAMTSGSGLGLHIVKTIVDSAAGKIQVSSLAEAGTTFTVSFPRTS